VADRRLRPYVDLAIGIALDIPGWLLVAKGDGIAVALGVVLVIAATWFVGRAVFAWFGRASSS
jgi:hypothetical protein